MTTPTFVYDLPYGVRSDLVASLDAGDAWRDLAGRRLGYDHLQIQRFSDARHKSGTSPADALLTHWGQRNGMVEELFKHLHAMQLYQSMVVIKPCVPKGLHGFMQTPPKRSSGASSDTISCLKQKQDAPPLPPIPAEIILQENLDVSEFDPAVEGRGKGLLFADEEDACRGHGELETRDGNLFRTEEETPIKRTAAAAAAATAAAAAAPSAPPPPPPPVVSRPHQVSQPVAVPAANIPPSAPAAGSAGATSTSSTATPLSQKLRTPSGVPLPTDALLNNLDFDVLKACCGNFDRKQLLGHGGFGEVYRGRLNDQDVAVKRILEEKRWQIDSEVYQRNVNQAITELQTMHSYRAENILTLLAISFDPTLVTDPCLVYQFMPNGRGDTSPLTWHQRANIALGTARGLRHLHAYNIIHGDIKSANVLLDKHFEPQIGDFGLARGGPEADCSFLMVSMVKGTQAYLPDDYIRSHQLTVAVDTFCYGIFMFELVSARSPSYVPPNNPHRQTIRELMLASQGPDHWVDEFSPPADSHWSQLLFYVGKDCAKKSWKQRPPMKVVLDNLDKLFQQPSAALALQVFYDEHKATMTSNIDETATEGVTHVLDSTREVTVAGAGQTSASTARVENGLSGLPDNDDDDGDEDASFSASSFSVTAARPAGNLIDFEIDPSLPNLSALLTKADPPPPPRQPPGSQQDLPLLSALGLPGAPSSSSSPAAGGGAAGLDGIPDLSVLQVDDERLAFVEDMESSAVSNSKLFGKQ